MRNLLLLSFDYFRRGEPAASYAVACLSASVLSDPDLWHEWAVDVVSIDLNREVPVSSGGLESLIRRKARFETYDAVAFGDYCWSSRYVRDLLGFLGRCQPRAHVLIGGYQVTSTPEVDLGRHYAERESGGISFVRGFAESSIVSALRALSNGATPPRMLEEPIDCKKLRSPWLSGELALELGVEKVRWETKRGCRYACDYCEFKAARNRPTRPDEMVLPAERLLEELELFRRHRVAKVNVLDPLFNIRGTYERLLEPMLRSGLSFTLQTRIEDLEQQDDLIEAARSNPRIHLEIGIQTLDEELNHLLCRNNQRDIILPTLGRLKREGVSFETNLIFGIPGQTPGSHLADIEALMEAGCPKSDIRCFPLRIPRGSRLEQKKADLHVQEMRYGSSDALVVKADGFDQRDWLRMLLISEADESYLDHARRMLADDSADVTDSWVGRRSWLLDAAVWLETLGIQGYRFRVMIANRDGTFTIHCEGETLDFIIDPPRRPPARVAPGVLHAASWVRPLLGRAGRSDVPRRYVLLNRELLGFKVPRPARVLNQTLDVSGRTLTIWATWRVEPKEPLALMRWHFKHGTRVADRNERGESPCDS
jgi:hypothetical protein